MTDSERALASLLELETLYRETTITATKYPAASSALWYITKPKSISRYCETVETCERVVPWDRVDSGDLPQFLFIGGPSVITFSCRVCQTRRASFWVNARLRPGDVAQLSIVGMQPGPRVVMSRELRSNLTDDDRRLYESALRARTDGMGIAAMAYLRRAVENEMERLLELLIANLVDAPQHIETLEAAIALRNENRFSERAKIADTVLPASFFPGNQNPFTLLHSLCSDGVHNLGDDESCDRFDEGKVLFELLFEKLIRDADSKRLYTEKLKGFKPRKSKPTQ